MRAEIKRLRGLGLEVIPKCNFSCGHSAWMKDYAYMVGTETYYKFCDDVVAELIDLFDTPRFFHLGLEEEDARIKAEKKAEKLPDDMRTDSIPNVDVNAKYGVCNETRNMSYRFLVSEHWSTIGKNVFKMVVGIIVHGVARRLRRQRRQVPG